ncbi:uncharacterized protein LOC133850771 [Drosophila sulfurigaster albostrigata]|uniref:uncharacterized protein LOC133850771 n=1 Tax=Drosophila sulfurigaster albostrigata TaxID=89887 RepID=UPI002D21B234|nr:uncharacterized protein LOC133850771 [Drosophila sulfurigaster albostrigata]
MASPVNRKRKATITTGNDNAASNCEINDSDEENSSCILSSNAAAMPGKSKVWQFFEKSKDGKFAKCKSCAKIYKTSGNTTNLRDHLRRLHPSLKVSDLPKS